MHDSDKNPPSSLLTSHFSLLPALVAAVLVFGLLAGPRPALASSRAEFWMAVARAHVRRGNPEMARESLRTVLELDPDHAEARSLLEQIGPGEAPAQAEPAPLPRALQGQERVESHLGSSARPASVPAGWPRPAGSRGVLSQPEAGPAVNADRPPAGFQPDPADRIGLPSDEAGLLAILHSGANPGRKAAAKEALASLYLERAREHEAANRRARAMLFFRKAHAATPWDPVLNYEIFQALIRRGRAVEAVPFGEAFLEARPGGQLAQEVSARLQEASLKAAESHISHSRWDLAIELLQKVIHADPAGPLAVQARSRLASGYYALATSHHINGRYRQAGARFLDLLSVRPDDEEGRERFEKLYGRNLRLRGVPSLLKSAEGLMDQGRDDEARPYLEAVLSLVPGSGEASRARQMLDQMAPAYDPAYESWGRTGAETPGPPSPPIDPDEVRRRLGRFEQR